MRIIDISPPVTPALAVWPGDTPYGRERLCRIDEGDNIELGTVRTTVHLGAHTDAPLHYRAGLETIGERPLEIYLGRCQVLDVTTPRGERILPEHVLGTPVAPRVLFKTGSFPDPNAWNNDFCSLSPELVEWLYDEGVRLVGIDTPSIDPMDSKALESHQAVADRDMAILEGIVLEGVAAGIYTLCALPLRLMDADASPVRAVLLGE